MIVITLGTNIKVPADKVWEVLAHRFGEADAWASSINKSSVTTPTTAKDVPYSGRTCDTTQGVFHEAIRTWDEQNKTLAYEITKGFPFFVKQGSNTWRIEEKSADLAKVSMKMELQTRTIIGILMSPMMKMQMSKVAGQVIEELTHFLEQGKPHPRKQKALHRSAKTKAA